MVRSDTAIPSLHNSPWIRGAPHSGFAAATLLTRDQKLLWSGWSFRKGQPLKDRPRAASGSSSMAVDCRSRCPCPYHFSSNLSSSAKDRMKGNLIRQGKHHGMYTVRHLPPSSRK
jgi:hypothetical protein